MESASYQAFDSDEDERCLSVESYSRNEFTDDELCKSMNLCVNEDDNIIDQAVENFNSSENGQEPQIGMEFNSREDAREFYVAYDHNHSLMSPSKVPWRGSGKNMISEDEKDQRIRELTLELYNERQRCKRRCAAYQEQLQMVLKFVDEHSDHLSRSVQDMVQRIRVLEDEDLDGSD
ncbi:hypothetical protein Vadar_028167 [Vaccinium darrowii]|uniref:Uncharacterized protein n=1 Tax=Vaccinium darrowii TaxID=229202 RepID=A0ACB7ZF03_9ERIC|nr:hypothetical protein Vadar_028167 [Vaccinium darrowii]